MKAFLTLLKTESKLVLRSMDSVIFGIAFPVAMAFILGIIYGNKPAFEGASYTFLEQSFGAIVAIGICATGLMGIPLSIADYRHKKILKRYRVTPVSPLLLLLVQVMIQFMITVISSIFVFGVMAIFFGYRMQGGLLIFLLSYLLVTVSIYGIGMMLASISPNMKTANLLCTLVYFPMLFLSGATIPYEVMPRAMQTITNVLPLTQGIKLLKSFSLGNSIDGSLFPILLLLGIALVGIGLSIKFFQWE